MPFILHVYFPLAKSRKIKNKLFVAINIFLLLHGRHDLLGLKNE